jgi:hypothetical protein
MNYDQLFTLINLTVVPFWLLMIALPRWRWTERIIASPLIALPPALIYAFLVLPQMGGLLAILGNPTVNSIAQLLSTPDGATIGWAHFLAFDLLIGRWAYLDSRERGVHSLLMVPALFFIFMFGPIGFLLYLLVRGVYALLRSTVRSDKTVVA